MCAVRSNLVRRPFSITGRLASREIARSGRAKGVRKRVFGGATSPSAPVRRLARAHSCLFVHAERWLLARVQDRGRDVLKLCA